MTLVLSRRPGIAILDQEIAAGLATSPYQIELYSENLEVNFVSR